MRLIPERILYFLYLGLTVAETVALLLAGMPLFDAVTHAFTTVSTGGFSIKNASVAAYGSVAVECSAAATMRHWLSQRCAAGKRRLLPG